MNKKQKIIIGIGLALILLSGLFPAYEGVWNKTGDNYKQYLGYYFIFSPPSSIKVAKTFYEGYEDFVQEDLIQFNANIIVSRYLIQIVTILLLTIGLVFLFADPKYDSKFPNNKKEI